MIDIRHLTKDFDGLKAVDDLSLTFQPGVTGLVGENGAGKSTLFRLISGVYHVTSGEIFIDDIPCQNKEAKAKLFFLPDDPFAPRGANIAGVLYFYKAIVDIDEDRFWSFIDSFDLPRKQNVGTFSKGMKRKVFLAIALSAKVTHLLLDEAFDGLDPLVVEKVKEAIIEEGHEKVIVVSSHNIITLQRLADRFVILCRGKLSKDEKTEDLGIEFQKFQAAFPREITEYDIAFLGYKVVSFKRVGSVYNFVIIAHPEAEGRINEAYHPMFLESVPIDPDEIVALEMLMARREAE